MGLDRRKPISNMKDLAKETLGLLALVGECKTMREVKELMDTKGREVEDLAYKELIKDKKSD